MAVPSTLYVITYTVLDDVEEAEGVREPEVWTSKELANKAARKLIYRVAQQLDPDGDASNDTFCHNLDDEGLYRGTMESGTHGQMAIEMYVYEVTLNTPSTREYAKKPIDGPGNWLVDDVDEGDGNDDDDDNDDDANDGDTSTRQGRGKKAIQAHLAKASKRSKSQPSTKTTRKKIPKGRPNCLEGLKILFTGTFETMDRVTSIATAKKYGAEIITNLEDTDYIVTGSRIGPKKAKVINELELETINEEEFFFILENGVGADKRQRMANRRRADEEEAPEDARKKRKR